MSERPTAQELGALLWNSRAEAVRLLRHATQESTRAHLRHLRQELANAEALLDANALETVEHTIRTIGPQLAEIDNVLKTRA